MMDVLVSDIPPEGLAVSLREEAAAFELSIDGRFVHPVEAELLLEKTDEMVRVTGQVRLSVMLDCVRCLREFPATFGIEVDAHYLPGAPRLEAGVHPMPANEAENYYYSDDVLRLDDLIRQETLLAMPYRPECQPGCRGLCAQCGQDLNVGTCQCAPPPDPRLAVLREYLKKK
jgi:uncharacterized protein